MADNTEPPDTRSAPRSPVIRWLHNNSTWLSALGAIAAVVVLVPSFFGSSETSVDNTVHVEGNNNGGQIAGGDITNVGDPQDGKTIASQQQTIQTQQETINRLLSRLPIEELNTNEQIREQITDAVTGVADLDSEPSQIKQAEAALASGDTEQAQALYRADAENKVMAGEAQLRGAAESYRRLGALAYLTDTAAAIEAYKQAVDIWPTDTHSWAQLGHLYLLTGELEQAIDANKRVGKLADSTDEPQLWAAISYGNLGNVHLTRRELDQAAQMYEDALGIYIELDNKEGMASTYGNLGNVYERRDELDKAFEKYNLALDLYKNLGHKIGIADQYGSLGIVHERRDELDQAFEKYNQALDLYKELGHKLGMANQYGNLGNAHRACRGLDQAAQMYAEALALNEELGHKLGIANQYINLGLLYEIRGELNVARKFGEMAAGLHDTTKSSEADRIRSWLRQLGTNSRLAIGSSSCGDSANK